MRPPRLALPLAVSVALHAAFVSAAPFSVPERPAFTPPPVVQEAELELGPINVGVYEGNWAYAYDSHWRAYPLSVRAGAPGAGVLAPPRRWEVLKARGHAPG